MKTAHLNGAAIPDRAALHDMLAEQFQFPAHYGRNLDALYDLLTEQPEGAYRVEIENPEALEGRLGGYYRVFLGVLEDAGVPWAETGTAEKHSE